MKRAHLTLPLLSFLLLFVSLSCTVNRLTTEERDRRIELHVEACSGYLAMSEWLRAEDQALRGLKYDSESFILRLFLARALLNLGSTDQILRAEFILSDLDHDDDFRVPLTMGAITERKGLALEEAANAVRSGERYTEADDPEARARELEEESKETYRFALEKYLEAFELEPGDTEILYGLARATCLLGEYEDSLAWAEASIRITASSRVFWREQLQRPNLTDREEKRMRGSIARLDDNEVAVHLQAETIMARYLNDPAGALSHLDAIIAFDPGIPETHSRRAQNLAKLKRYEEAMAAIDEYLKLVSLEFDHPDIQRAYRLRNEWMMELAGVKE
jgi:tetratricopeptide (TPR) repeat protein